MFGRLTRLTAAFLAAARSVRFALLRALEDVDEVDLRRHRHVQVLELREGAAIVLRQRREVLLHLVHADFGPFQFDSIVKIQYMKIRVFRKINISKLQTSQLS